MDNSNDRIPGSTGRRKTAAMLADLRAFKRDGWLDPMGALLRLDDTHGKCWAAAIAQDVGFVMQALSEMIETDDAFRKVRNPASWMNAKLWAHGAELRKSRKRA